MAKEKQRDITRKDVEILRRARKQLEIVKSARNRCNEIVSAHAAVKSPRLDGMPRGTRMSCGLDGRAEHADQLLSILDREEKRLKEYQRAARKVIRLLPERLYGFGLYYYLEGLTVLEVSEILDRSERACWGYKRSIERAGEIGDR